MALLYPYSISNLDGSGQFPVDGEPVRAEHFNRLVREVGALQSALGPGKRLRGTKADLKTRLAGEMNDDGTLKRELLTDDDQSGNKRGTTRYFDGQKEDTVLGDPLTSVGDMQFIPMAYTLWEEPPVFFFTFGNDDNAWDTDAARRLIVAISEVGVRVNFRKFDGANIGETTNGETHWFACSRRHKVWKDNVAWAMRPIRTGS